MSVVCMHIYGRLYRCLEKEKTVAQDEFTRMSALLSNSLWMEPGFKKRGGTLDGTEGKGGERDSPSSSPTLSLLSLSCQEREMSVFLMARAQCPNDLTIIPSPPLVLFFPSCHFLDSLDKKKELKEGKKGKIEDLLARDFVMKDFDDRFRSDSSTSSSLSFCLLSLDSMNEWTLFSSTSFHLLLFVWLMCVFGVSFYEQTFLEFLPRQDFLLSIKAWRLCSQPFIMSFPYIYRQRRRRWRRRRATWFQRKRQSVSPTSVPVVNRVLWKNRIVSLYFGKWISHFTHNNNGKRWKLEYWKERCYFREFTFSFVRLQLSLSFKRGIFFFAGRLTTQMHSCVALLFALDVETKDSRKRMENLPFLGCRCR